MMRVDEIGPAAPPPRPRQPLASALNVGFMMGFSLHCKCEVRFSIKWFLHNLGRFHIGSLVYSLYDIDWYRNVSDLPCHPGSKRKGHYKN